ncbi:MAG TPA: TonB-dependent receptor [Thermoanaerobaculia bacterium]|nr:TonB-dependent receptor [Thermoanaerobaculia bacterium]
MQLAMATRPVAGLRYCVDEVPSVECRVRIAVWPQLALLLVVCVPVAARGESPPDPASGARHSEEVTITATRTETRIGDTPSSVVVLSREVIETSPAATADDMLRQVPGFTLFRRAGSRVANPTAQGVTLRGIGASGASRALVLDDGIPLNDPFGGWVYWGRVSHPSLERVEIVRGGGSDLYGSGAMGGVVQFIRRRDPAVTAEASGGSQSTRSAAAYAAIPHGEWRGALSLDVFGTGGHILVAPEQRGSVDRRADSQHLAADLSVHRHAAFLRFSHFDEKRNNGTPLQTNATTLRQLAGGGELPLLGGRLTGRGWLGEQDYAQTFSAVSADRESERLTVDQRIPSRSAGSSLQWSRAIGDSHALVAGLDLRHVSGRSEERQFAPAGATTEVVSSGRQRTVAGFVEDVLLVSPALSITAGLRLDGWEREHRWSPRLAALYRPARGPALTASAYRAFRAPTLNELHRGFRVGNVVTLANADLGAETVTGFEAGVRGRNVRATLFWMEMDDLIANVTLSATPSLITRQRRNVERGRSRGMELEGEWRLTPSLRASAGYLFSDATFGSGNRLPQVPRHQATAQARFTARFTAALQARWSAMQYDDDLNRLPLRGYVVADAFVAVPIGRRISATLALENIFDEPIEVSATPVTTLGQPRAIRAGLRYTR